MPNVTIAIPVFNGEAALAGSVRLLSRYCESQSEFGYEIVVADNGSTDRSLEIAKSLHLECPELRVSHIEERGRGRALKKAWGESSADILAYMDVDLSTDLKSLLPLVQAVAYGGFDIAIGSRLHAGSRTRRSWRREVISRCYNRL